MKRDKQGKIILKKGFFAKYLWGPNFWRFMMFKKISLLVELTIDGWNKEPNPNPEYPKNLCSLFWGWIFSPVCWAWTIPNFIAVWLVSIPLCIIKYIFVCIWFILGFLLGYMPIMNKNYQYSDFNKYFHPYRDYGEKDEKRIPITPWQILIFTFCVWLLVKNSFALPRGMWIITFSVITSYYAWILIGGIGIIIGLGFFFKSNAGEVIIEFIKAKKQKICPLITFEEE